MIGGKGGEKDTSSGFAAAARWKRRVEGRTCLPSLLSAQAGALGPGEEGSGQRKAISCQPSAVSLNQKIQSVDVCAWTRTAIVGAARAGPACRACCRRRQVPWIRGDRSSLQLAEVNQRRKADQSTSVFHLDGSTKARCGRDLPAEHRRRHAHALPGGASTPNLTLVSPMCGDRPVDPAVSVHELAYSRQ